MQEPLCNCQPPACKPRSPSKPGTAAVARQAACACFVLCRLLEELAELLCEGESLQAKQAAALAARAALLRLSLCAWENPALCPSHTHSPSLQLLGNKSCSAQGWAFGICPSVLIARVFLQAPLLKGRCFFPHQALLESSGYVCSP